MLEFKKSFYVSPVYLSVYSQKNSLKIVEIADFFISNS